jgi:hypothetical protein
MYGKTDKESKKIIESENKPKSSSKNYKCSPVAVMESHWKAFHVF